MPLLFAYPLEPAPPLAVYEHIEACPVEPGPEALSVALPAAMLPLAVRWHWSPTYAIVVFTGPFWGSITDRERNSVWDHWGVPVFEYRLNASGRVIAQECEAHSGSHVLPGTPIPGDAVEGRCPCGQTSPRIGMEHNRFVHAAAAAAA